MLEGAPLFVNRCGVDYSVVGQYADVKESDDLGYNREFLRKEHYPVPGGYFMRTNPPVQAYKLAPLGSASFIFKCDKKIDGSSNQR